MHWSRVARCSFWAHPYLIAVLELLGADADTSFDITTDGHALVLVPIKDAKRQRAFRSALGKVNEKYSKALKRLAE